MGNNETVSKQDAIQFIKSFKTTNFIPTKMIFLGDEKERKAREHSIFVQEKDGCFFDECGHQFVETQPNVWVAI